MTIQRSKMARKALRMMVDGDDDEDDNDNEDEEEEEEEQRTVKTILPMTIMMMLMMLVLILLICTARYEKEEFQTGGEETLKDGMGASEAGILGQYAPKHSSGHVYGATIVAKDIPNRFRPPTWQPRRAHAGSGLRPLAVTSTNSGLRMEDETLLTKHLRANTVSCLQTGLLEPFHDDYRHDARTWYVILTDECQNGFLAWDAAASGLFGRFRELRIQLEV
ncbi:hypothetical protein AK812_SmicGene17749 [Symbiodinium microadriaticum]|uniref:Uncharacterized protein n=1 Tax=Symbiodinium microadriaticum TaxID=2951 RepID=A0A1Q9DWX9_SYMMI|nr:hypothetical protein AK812_SmicGene17749 [Symbiodinium microadriaticum]